MPHHGFVLSTLFGDRTALGFLHREYEPRYFWWEIVEVVKKLVLIGFASLSWAAVMGGIGGAMNDLTEAQHILGPLFMVMMVFFLPAIAAIATP